MLTAGIKWPAMKLLERSESILRGDPGGNPCLPAGREPAFAPPALILVSGAPGRN